MLGLIKQTIMEVEKMERVQVLSRQFSLGWVDRFSVRSVALFMARQRQRRALLKLNEQMLKDIGISRGEAEAEAAKPFWRA